MQPAVKTQLLGDGPKWLFDIDVLTKSMNYVPVVAGTNSNDLVDGSLFDSSSKNASNDEPQPPCNAGKKDDKGVCKESRIANQERPKNSTQGVNTARPSINTKPDMFSLEDNATLEATHVDFFGDETEVGMSNITTTYPVPSTPNTRIHKDHSLNHVIGDVQSGVQTRKMTTTTNEQGFISAVYEGKTHEDLHTCLFAYFLSQVEPKKGLHSQEDGFDYDEVFCSVARIEAIRLKRSVCLSSPGLKIPEFHDRVYNDDIIFGSTKKELCTELGKLMHKKFQMSFMVHPWRLQSHCSRMQKLKMLMFTYRSMIGSLMYLTASRPDIMLVILKRSTKLGLWYPKDSPFDLEAYSNSDYTGASLDRKSTLGGCQFLRSRLISWQCKKQTIVANSTTEAYAAKQKVNVAGLMGGEGLGQPTEPQHTPTTASPYNVEPIPIIASSSQPKKTQKHRTTKRKATEISQSSGPTTLVADDIIHEERGDCMERAATTAASLDAEQDSGNIIRTQSMATLNEPIPQDTSSGSGPRRQYTILGDIPAQTRFESLSKQSNDPPLSRVNTLGSGEDSMKLNELIDICIRLSESGRNEIDQDEGILSFQEDAKTQERYGHDIKINTASTSITTASINITIVEPVTTASAPITTAGVSVSTAEPSTPPTITILIGDEDLTIAQTLMKMRSVKSKEKGVSSKTATTTKGVTMQEPSKSGTRKTVPPPQHDPKDKGKAKMIELEKPLKKGSDQV
ncbi:hypothetical protein Tco_0465886 [Tanacetum coccineum]